MEITWNIVQLDRKTEDNFVTTAHWTCTAIEENPSNIEKPFNDRAYGSCGFDGELTTPYENLTQEQVLSWVWEQVDKDGIEASLAAQIEAQKNPVSATGVPW